MSTMMGRRMRRRTRSRVGAGKGARGRYRSGSVRARVAPRGVQVGVGVMQAWCAAFTLQGVMTDWRTAHRCIGVAPDTAAAAPGGGVGQVDGGRTVGRHPVGSPAVQGVR